MDFNAIWQSIKDFFTGNYLNIIKFFSILVIGIIVIKILISVFKKVFEKTKMENMAQKFILTIIKFLLWLILILSLLSVVGVEVSGIITAFSALVLAVGMALQSNIANLANGIVIISMKMFRKGDYLSVNGVEGSVTEINFLFTTLTTPDNKKITLPNSAIVGNAVTNYGANPKRRVQFTFSVAYESDVELVKKTVTDVMASCGKVYLDPAPFCKLKELGASSIDFFSYCWCDSSDYWDVYYYVMENVFNEFKRNGVSIPFNQLEIRERKDQPVMPVINDALPERVEKQRTPPEKSFIEELTESSEKIKKKIKNDIENKKKRKKEK